MVEKGEHEMGNNQLVVAFFDNEEAADEAVDKIKKWDKGRRDIELDNIGVLVKNKKGKIKTHKFGKRKTGTGVAVGAVAGVLSGGLTLVGGVVVGGILGAFFHKGLGLSKEDLARFDSELDGGKAAVCILTEYDEAATFSNMLTSYGGVPESYEVTEEALEHAETAAEEITADETAD
jgi:uncharacterized membrane protein